MAKTLHYELTSGEWREENWDVESLASEFKHAAAPAVVVTCQIWAMRSGSYPFNGGRLIDEYAFSKVILGDYTPAMVRRIAIAAHDEAIETVKQRIDEVLGA